MKKTFEELAEEYSIEGAEQTRRGLNTYESGMYVGFKDGYEAAKPKWVRVEDELPELNTYVLVLCDTKEIIFCELREYQMGELIWSDSSGLTTDFNPQIFPKWMPLPELPEVEEDE